MIQGLANRVDRPALFTSIAFGLALTFILTLLDSPQASSLPWTLAWLFWAIEVFGLLSACWIAERGLARLRPKMNRWALHGVAGVVGGLLFAPFAMGLDVALGIPDPDDSALLQGWFGEWLDEALVLTPFSLIGWGALSAILGLVARPSPSSPETPLAELPSGFRTPERVSADTLLCVLSEQHYLRFVYEDGDELVLGTMEDVDTALQPLGGIRAHRSAWINTRFLADLKPKGSAYAAVLSSGLEAPVARRRAPEVRTALRRKRGGR